MKKNLILLFLICKCVTCLYSQIDIFKADDIVINIISLGSVDSISVFRKTNTLSESDTILLFDGNMITSPYDSCYVYFIDDQPLRNWGHQCRYIFLDINSGDYTITNANTYPDNIHKDYNMVSLMHFPAGSYVDIIDTISKISITQAEIDSSQYAVFINGCNDRYRFWADMSNVYNTLVNIYGFPKNHIYVHSRGFNNIHEAPTLNINHPYSLDENPDSEINFSDEKEIIHSTFNELAGITDTIADIPRLSQKDKLFIFVTDHGNTFNGNSYINISYHEGGDQTFKLFDYEFADWLRPINCGQMTILMQQCYSGGFVDDLMDMTNVMCKNRVIHTATDATHLSYSEFHITAYKPIPDSYRMDEFTFFWCAAASGYYASPVKPWMALGVTGQFDFSTYFYDSGHPTDYSPDINQDGTIQLNEIFAYADNFDSHSPNGYSLTAGTEYPMAAYSSTFSEKLGTIDGCAGIIDENISTSELSVYHLSGDIQIGSNSTFTAYRSRFYNKANYKIIINGSANISYSSFYDVCLSFRNTPLNSIPAITNNGFINTNTTYSIELRNCPNFNIFNNGIISKDNGIQLYYCGNGMAGNQTIVGNVIRNCHSSGILSYNSMCDIRMNKIFNNNYGVKLLNSSTVTMCGDSSATTVSQTQNIRDNTRSEIYVTHNSFPSIFKYNAIYNEHNSGNGSDTLIFYDGSFFYNQQDRNLNFDVTMNYWGSNFDSLTNLKSTSGFDFIVSPIWVIHNGYTPEEPPVRMLNNANTLFETGLYTDAKELYQQIVNYYPSTNYALTAMKEMLRLEYFATNDYNTLKQYYLNDSSIITDSSMCVLGSRLANKCDEILGNYEYSIAWYNKIINNPSSYQDSIFAIIDLENLYLNIDTNKNIGNYECVHPEYDTQSLSTHEKHRDYLLSLLPSTKDGTSSNDNHSSDMDIKFADLTIYPNPFKDVINISVPENSDELNISIYTITGVLIERIDTNNTVINLDYLPAGIYFINFINKYGDNNIRKIMKI